MSDWWKSIINCHNFLFSYFPKLFALPYSDLLHTLLHRVLQDKKVKDDCRFRTRCFHGVRNSKRKNKDYFIFYKKLTIASISRITHKNLTRLQCETIHKTFRRECQRMTDSIFFPIFCVIAKLNICEIPSEITLLAISLDEKLFWELLAFPQQEALRAVLHIFLRSSITSRHLLCEDTCHFSLHKINLRFNSLLATKSTNTGLRLQNLYTWYRKQV